MLEHGRQFGAHAQFPRAAVQRRHAHHQMAQKLPLARVIADHADLVGGQFVQLAQVVKDHARGQKVGVEEGIDLADGAGGAQHRRGVVQSPSASAWCNFEAAG